MLQPEITQQAYDIGPLNQHIRALLKRKAIAEN
jgi:hypothetical protein